MQEQPATTHHVLYWDDEKRIEEHKLFSREFLDDVKAKEKRAHDAHVEYAKWLLASLLIVHGGTIYGVVNLSNKLTVELIPSLTVGLGFSLAGIVFTLLTGGIVWINFQLSNKYWEELYTPHLLYLNNAVAEKNVQPSKWIDRTFYGAIASATLAWICLPIAVTIILVAIAHGHFQSTAPLTII